MNNSNETLKSKIDQYISVDPLVTERDKERFFDQLHHTNAKRKFHVMPALVTIAVFIGFVVMMLSLLSDQQEKLIPGQENEKEPVHHEEKEPDVTDDIKEEKPVEPVEEPKLTDEEVRVIMNKYLEMDEMRIKFMGEELEFKTENIDKYYETFEDKMRNYVTSNFMEQENQKEVITYYIGSHGEGHMVPDFDLRFDIIENTPQRVVVKSVVNPLLISSYIEYGSNAYLRAVKENNEWKIDDIYFTDAPEEPVNFTWEEILKFNENSDLDLQLVGETYLDAEVARGRDGNIIMMNTKVYLVESSFYEYIVGITEASGNLILEIPDGVLPK
ncbi:hypothetical protein FZW96_07425 [Bacillus sp. BGMRC 2118]|nr:hypothetical protein FZW96_07425 [Bacillus sp. BGMRC 2118]